MDDIFGILFYILIIVLGGIISAYRNKSKRKMMVPKAPSLPGESELEEKPVPGYDPFRELTKRFEFDIDEPVADSEMKPETTLQSDLESLESIAEKPEEEGMAVFEETREVMQSDSGEKDTVQDDDQIFRSQISDPDTSDESQKQSYINLADNIKQGIIYSEILKRKHF